MTEDFAAYILKTAIEERRAAEMLDVLFAGGSVTVHAGTGKLLLVTAEQLGMTE